MEEAQVLGEPTAHAHVAARMVAAAGLQDRIESERPEAVKDFVQDPPIRVRDAEDAAAVATLRIEDSGEKPEAPATGGIRRPRTDFLNALEMPSRRRADPQHAPAHGKRFLEEELARRNLELMQVIASAPLAERSVKLLSAGSRKLWNGARSGEWP